MNSFDPWSVMRVSPPTHYFSHPFYTQGAAYDGTWPTPMGGAFIGDDPTARAPNGLRAKLTAAVAPVIAPGANGFTAHMKLDDKQRLHAAICIDGKRYEGSINLAPAIAALLAKIAQYHTNLHASMPLQGPVISGDAMLSAVDRAVAAAGDALIEELASQHTSVACAGWLDDVGNAIKGTGITVYRGVTETAQKLKGPITAAAVTYATALGGPQAGAAAAQFVGPIIDSAANLGKDTPQKAEAEQQAKTDPAAARALTLAKDAVAHNLVAYHVMETAQQAATGNPAAQQQVAQVVQDAEKGDPVAHAVAPLIQHGFSRAMARRHHRPRGHTRELHPSLIQEIDRRFWELTQYNPGRRLNPQVPADAQMIPVWQAIAAQVQQEHAPRSTVRGRL